MLVNNIPLDEGTMFTSILTEDQTSDKAGTLLGVNFPGGDAFKALGVKLVEGRLFTNEEAVTPNTSVILSRSAADKLWPGQDPLGRRLRVRMGAQDTTALSVVGVVNDVKQLDWREAAQSVIYLPLTGSASKSRT